LVTVLFPFAPATRAQGGVAGQSQSQPEEQNETMLDTLKRMQIKREENEHKKLLEKGVQIKDEADALSKETPDPANNRLPRLMEKKLKEIEKSAKQIRSETGGAEDEPLNSPPSNLADAIKQLCETSERLNQDLAKTSRNVVSISVLDDTNQIIQLVKILRGYLK
jgi:hypothetical protein